MPVLYLTFDDGPQDPATPAILDALRDAGAHATFFQEGRWVKLRPDIARCVAEEGHAVGNHAMTHRNLATLTDDALEEELRVTSDLIERAIGQPPTLFRPPYGEPFHEGSPPELVPKRDLIRSHASALGMGTVLWHAHASDWEIQDGRDARAVADHVISEAVDGNVVLLHDDLPRTAEAVPFILDALGAHGFVFEALPADFELAEMP